MDDDAHRESSAQSPLRRHQLPIAVVAACFFAVLWLGAEVTIARLEKENASLRGKAGGGFDAPSALPAAAPARGPAPAATAPVAGGPRTITAEQRETMLQVLYRDGRDARDAPDKRAWLVRASADREASAHAEALAGIFRDAGWKVEVTAWTNGLLKPGVRLFVGPEEPPPVAELVQRALEAGGVTVQQFVGYRAYRIERAAAEPSLPGIDLGADQDFVIVVGRAE